MPILHRICLQATIAISRVPFLGDKAKHRLLACDGGILGDGVASGEDLS